MVALHTGHKLTTLKDASFGDGSPDKTLIEEFGFLYPLYLDRYKKTAGYSPAVPCDNEVDVRLLRGFQMCYGFFGGFLR